MNGSVANVVLSCARLVRGEPGDAGPGPRLIDRNDRAAVWPEVIRPLTKALADRMGPLLRSEGVGGRVFEHLDPGRAKHADVVHERGAFHSRVRSHGLGRLSFP